MKKVIFDIPMGPSSNAIESYLSLHQSPKIIIKENHISYLFDDENKKGDLLITKFQLSTFANTSEKKEVTVFKTNYILFHESEIRYIPSHETPYLVIYYLSTNKDFYKISEGELTHHKKGDWVITSLNNGNTIHSLHFPKDTFITGISIFIPTETLKIFINNPSDKYLNRLINFNDSPHLIYESVNTRLKQLFEEINKNQMNSLVETMNFQENIYALLKSVFEQLSQNNANAIKYSFKKNDLDSLARAEELLLRDIKKPPTIQSLANESAMSPSKFKSAFKKVYGESVYKYFLNYRMQLAHKWLLEK